MAVMDEFKNERDSIKNGTLKQKISYFWCYYKWHVICSVLALVAIISLVHSIVTRKDVAFYAVMLNGFDGGTAQEYASDVADFFNLDTEEYTVLFDTSMYIDYNSRDQRTMTSAQKLMVYLTAADLDVVISDTASLQHYSYIDTFMDLRELLSPEQLEKYQYRFYYIDRRVIEAKNSADEADVAYMFDYPEDPTDPSTMADPVPVGIYVDDQADFTENFLYERKDLVLAAVSNTKRPEMVREYIDYIFEK